ncbi:MAG TPA: hypothetical protein VMV77_14075 [Bacteroidales bacterium]|nr:hypothetical protein [Bacteroidales bacterium]
MKRKLLFGAAFLFVVWAATSCEALSDCKVCKLVTRDSSGDIVNSGSDTEYCGTDLITIQATPSVTNPLSGDITTYECR